MRKKLQVFISSTYTDLIEERQAAVQAVLDAGHIPAGMELFKAGNDSQLKTIYQWIDASDVYMLILGGRYGSIESKSKKSYTQLEYEYAISKNIPVFAVVLSDSFLYTKAASQSNSVFESDYQNLYSSFKKLVLTKIVRIVDDVKDIQLTIHTTLQDFIEEYELIGWVRSDTVASMNFLKSENSRLLHENYLLLQKNQKLSKQLEDKPKDIIGDYSYDELCSILSSKIFRIPSDCVTSGHEYDISALNLFLENYERLSNGVSSGTRNISSNFLFQNCCPYLRSFGLLEKSKLPQGKQRYQVSKLGNKFFALHEIKKFHSGN